MKKLFAVSHINFYNHELTTEFHEAEDWREAAMQHKSIAEMFSLEPSDDKQLLDTFQEDAKAMAFDQDAMINVVEVPPEFLNQNRA